MTDLMTSVTDLMTIVTDLMTKWHNIQIWLLIMSFYICFSYLAILTNHPNRESYLTSLTKNKYWLDQIAITWRVLFSILNCQYLCMQWKRNMPHSRAALCRTMKMQSPLHSHVSEDVSSVLSEWIQTRWQVPHIFIVRSIKSSKKMSFKYIDTVSVCLIYWDVLLGR